MLSIDDYNTSQKTTWHNLYSSPNRNGTESDLKSTQLYIRLFFRPTWEITVILTRVGRILVQLSVDNIIPRPVEAVIERRVWSFLLKSSFKNPWQWQLRSTAKMLYILIHIINEGGGADGWTFGPVYICCLVHSPKLYNFLEGLLVTVQDKIVLDEIVSITWRIDVFFEVPWIHWPTCAAPYLIYMLDLLLWYSITCFLDCGYAKTWIWSSWSYYTVPLAPLS